MAVTNPCMSCMFFPSDYDSHASGIGCNYALINGRTRTGVFRRQLGVLATADRVSWELTQKPCKLYKADPGKRK